MPETVDGVRQIPFEGKSLLPSFTNAAAPEVHTEQYFEIFGNRAIYKDGWVAAAKRSYQPWALLKDVARIYTDDTAKDRWELYHVAEDFSESRDLAQDNPAKLEELKAEFVKEGTRNGVFPLVPLPFGAPALVDPRQKPFTYRPGISGIPTSAQPVLAGRAHRLEVDIPGNAATAKGVLIAQGGRLGGHVLYVKNGHLTFEHNAYGHKHEVIAETATLPAGPVTVAYEFTPAPSEGAGFLPLLPKAGAGTIQVFVNGQSVAQGAVTLFPVYNGSFWESFDIGLDRGSQVSREPAARLPFSLPLGETRLVFK